MSQIGIPQLLVMSMLLGGLTCFTETASAQTADPAQAEACEHRSVCTSRRPRYIALHATGVGVLALAALITNNAFDPPAPVDRDVAPTTLGMADAFLTLEMSLPLPALAIPMRREELFDASLMYSQAALLGFAANNVLRRFEINSSATVGFAAAMTSAYLLDQRRYPDDPPVGYKRHDLDVRVRGSFWGLQFGLATANAVLDARGGRSHIYSEFIGAGVGMIIGVTAQAVHCESNHHRCFEPSFYTASGGDSRFLWLTNLGLLGLGASLPFLAPASKDDPNLHYQLAPLSFGPDSIGIGLQGNL